MFNFNVDESGWIGDLARIAFAACLLVTATGESSGEVEPGTPETRTLTAEEADAVLQQDWLFQADDMPTKSRVRQEIRWTREMAHRLSKRPDAPDLGAELKELNRLERRLADARSKPAEEKQKPATSPPDGLIARWTFDEIDGKRLADVSGNKRSATVHGWGKLVAGVYGKAMALNGGGYVTTAPELGPSPRQITPSAAGCGRRRPSWTCWVMGPPRGTSCW